MLTLTTNAQIREAIQSVLARTDVRRVVLSGFVGEGAEELIPKPKGVEVYCWDREGATNPDAVRALLRTGAKVFFVSNLHCKVYWGSGRGCVVGSANLSQNGLGNEGLSEVAVQLPARSFDMTSYLRRLRHTRVTEAVLNEFEERCRRYRGRNKAQELLTPNKALKRTRRRTPTFAEWMSMDYPMPWSIEIADTFFNHRDEKEIVRRGLLTDKDVDSEVDYWTGEKGMTTPGRWLLFVEVGRIKNAFAVNWCCADEQIPSRRLGPNLREDLAPWFAIQRSETKHFGVVPFNAEEPRFQKALKQFLKDRRAMNYEGACALARNGKLKPEALDGLLEQYTKTSPN